MRHTKRERGAALIIALALMAILLAIGLTFYTVSQVELRTATNVSNTVRVDLLADAAVAIGMAHLNQDFFSNPDATSNDHAWRSIFNGTWVAGKPWALRQDAQGNVIPLQEGGVPQVDLNAFPYVEFVDGHREALYRGKRTRDWLTIPRVEGGSPVMYEPESIAGFLDIQGNPVTFNPQPFNAAAHPFAVSSFFAYNGSQLDPQERALYPAEEIHLIADVDNSGDGLRDSIWIPLPGDLFFPDDGIDNNLNGFVDSTAVPAGHEALGLNPGVFVYWGGNDGLDNNGDGTVDGPSEQKYFLTAPLPGLEIFVDVNGDGVVPDFDINGTPITVRIPPSLTIDVLRDPVTGNPLPTPIQVTLTNDDVDVIDNDYDLLINNYSAYAYVGPDHGEWLPARAGLWSDAEMQEYQVPLELSYHDINIERYFPALFGNPLRNPANGQAWEVMNAAGNIGTIPGRRLRVTHTGEPVTELIGRAAILMRDEASKVNVNVAGGHTYRGDVTPVRTLGRLPLGPGGLLTRPSAGIGPHEYETRVLPGIGEARARNLWNTLTGLPRGGLGAGSGQYAYDVSYPGYGRVDDTGTALLYALNRRDDTGTGLIDEGLYLPHPNHPLFEVYADHLGAFEGIDDPGERRRFRPHRNLIAEQDGLDNDGSGVVDQVGELGDRQFMNVRQVRDLTAPDIGAAVVDAIGGELTPFSTDRSVNYFLTERGVRGISRVDYNHATPQHIAANFMIRGDYIPVTRTQIPDPENAGVNIGYLQNPVRGGGFPPYPVTEFAMGLRQGDVHLSAPSALNVGGYRGGFLHVAAGLPATTLGPPWLAGDGVHALPADRQLQAMQAAVNIVDNRDRDHRRSVLTTENAKPIDDNQDVAAWPRPGALGPRGVVPEQHLLPLQPLERHLRTTLNVDKPLQAVDRWLMQNVGTEANPEPMVYGQNNAGDIVPEERRISYTTTGNEAIKINELMTRAVRRVEAEAYTGVTGAGDPVVNSPYFQTMPGNFNPAPAAEMPLFDVRRSTLQARLSGSNQVDPGPQWALTGSGPAGAGQKLGDNTALFTNEAYFPYRRNNMANAVVAGNAIQFQFMGTPPGLGIEGLPGGRYYLKVNVSAGRDAEGNVLTSIFTEGQLEYAIKYVEVDGNGNPTGGAQRSILDDLVTTANNLASVPPGTPVPTNIFETEWPIWTPVPQEHMAVLPGQAEGWVFLDGTPTTPAPAGYYVDGGGVLFAPGSPARTHTVTVPPAGSNVAMFVALRINPETLFDSPPVDPHDALAVNFFDFSQEPSHEWAELVNVSEEWVDLSLWQFEVGIPDSPGVRSDPYKSLWEIPQGTQIAPGGKLVLGFDKFDLYRFPQGYALPGEPANRINRNGMGLATSDGINGTGPLVPDPTMGIPLNGITVPPIGDTSPGFPATNALHDPTGSIFRREFYPEGHPNAGVITDYVDRDGDGVSSANVGAGTPDTDQTAVEFSGSSTRDTWQLDMGPAKPWDRIVQMRNVQWRTNPATGVVEDFSHIQDVDDVAYLVLRGGVFPNYPERDRIDNDGSGAYQLIGDDFWYAGILDQDMVDNNLDGRISVFDAAVGPTAISVIRPSFALPGGHEGTFHHYELMGSEGFDEGRHVGWHTNGRRFGAGSYEAGVLPYVIYRDRNRFQTRAGVYDPTDPDTYWTVTPGSPEFTAGHVAMAGNPGMTGVNVPALYIGSGQDPADWKAFTERRWFPGDKVIVSLYQGRAIETNVVDRVTYNELDVINRTVDDVMPSPYFIAPDGVPANMNQRAGLNPNFPTFWLPDHMGLDFYRSLQRKHPLYNGDRFGTTNRWQATDGNYDDWADSLSVFDASIRIVDPLDNAVWPYHLAENSRGPRFVDDRTLRLYGHALWASPLRMNLAHRISANAPDLVRTINEGPQPDGGPRAQWPQVPAIPDAPEDRLLANMYWTHEKAFVKNRPYQTVGDAIDLPHMTFQHRMIATHGVIANPEDRFLFDLSRANYSMRAVGTDLRQDIALRSAVIGPDESDPFAERDMLTAAMEGMSTDTVTLTAAQARMTPIRPFATRVAAEPGFLNWSNLGEAPAAWAPLYLFGFSGDDAQRYPNYVDSPQTQMPFMPLNHLLNGEYLLSNGNFTGGLSQAHLSARYDLDRRVTMYVSGYQPAANLAAQTGSEPENGRPQALFEWDGDSGLENGEYVVYIGTYLPELGERLERADTYLAASENTQMSAPGPVTEAFLSRSSPNQRLAVEVITDRTRAQGMQGINSPLDSPGLVHPANWNARTYTPGPDGYIFYGDTGSGSWRPQVVRVTDNYLALRVRNEGLQGQIGAITHVVLAPRSRTPGKVNVNTVENRAMRPTANTGTINYFNTLLGLPGVVDVAAEFGGFISPDSNLDPLNVARPAGQDSPSVLWPPPVNVGDGRASFAGTVPIPPLRSSIENPNPLSTNRALASAQLTSLMQMGRTEHYDGRYYTRIGELARDANGFANPLDGRVVRPLSNAGDPQTRYNEATTRLRRMANLLTTRSDVFEIIVTVQAGYGVDTDGDGWLNYRSDDEFVTTAETRTRVVYERRSAPDRIDQPAR